jgi:hypothetical protein
VWRQDVNRAQRASRVARMALKRMVDDAPSPALLANLEAKAAVALLEVLDALNDLLAIGQQARAERLKRR